MRATWGFILLVLVVVVVQESSTTPGAIGHLMGSLPTFKQIKNRFRLQRSFVMNEAIDDGELKKFFNQDVYLEGIIAVVISPFTCFEANQVDWFIINIVNNSAVGEQWKMLPVHYAQGLKSYKPIIAPNLTPAKDDMQIISSGPAVKVGHFILLLLRASTGDVEIYDPMYDPLEYNEIDKFHSRIIEAIYPKRKRVFKKPATTQDDGTACGAFCIKYAMLIMTGQDPANTPIELNTDPNTGHGDSSMIIRHEIVDMYLNKVIKGYNYPDPTQHALANNPGASSSTGVH